MREFQLFEFICQKIKNKNTLQTKYNLMIPDTEPTNILRKWIMSFKSDFQAFQSHIYQKLQKSLEEMQSTCEAKYKDVIIEQQQKIQQLEQSLDKFFKIQELMTGMPGNSRSNSRTNEEMRQVKRQTEQKHEMRPNHVQRNRRQRREENQVRESLPERQNQRDHLSNLVRRQNGENHQHQNNRNQEQQIDESSQSEQIDLILDSNQQQGGQNEDELSQESQPQSRLPPLQNIRNHSLRRVALTPNFTRISFVEYTPNFKIYAFSSANIQYLEKRDLRQVQSINIECQQMSDEIFLRLTRLSWNNIISLKIDGNLLTNLDPLRNFQLNKLVNLDVSMNQLNLSSAQLLASSQFDELIYFTVSFKTGINKQCWQILLKNGMSNFPKLEAVDICNSNQLGERTTQKIKDCMLLKSAQLRERIVQNERVEQFHFDPSSFMIKVKWHQSKQIHQKLTDSQAQQIHKKWIEQVDYKFVDIPRVHYQRRTSRRRVRGRGSRGRRGGRGNSVISHERQNDQSQISANRQPMSRSSMSENRRKIIHKNK